MNFSLLTRNVQRTMKKHGPAILTGLGIAGMVSTTVLAVKETPKALILIEERKIELDSDKLDPVEIIKTAWPCYIPAAATGVLSIFCLIGASTVSSRRNAALATAYTLTESALKEYKGKVVEKIGEKKEKEIRDDIAKDKIEKNPVSNATIVITGKSEALCMDPMSSRYFKADINDIKKAVNKLNEQMLNNTMYCSLNDFYEEIGLDPTSVGYELGWNITNGGTIQLDFSYHPADDDSPCLVIDFVNPPTYNFDKWL